MTKHKRYSRPGRNLQHPFPGETSGTSHENLKPSELLPHIPTKREKRIESTLTLLALAVILAAGAVFLFMGPAKAQPDAGSHSHNGHQHGPNGECLEHTSMDTFLKKTFPVAEAPKEFNELKE